MNFKKLVMKKLNDEIKIELVKNMNRDIFLWIYWTVMQDQNWFQSYRRFCISTIGLLTGFNDRNVQKNVEVHGE